MKSISLSEYVPVINAISEADDIYGKICGSLKEDDVLVDFSGIRFISTNCAKHIFGRLILQLGQENFYNKITLSNACDNVKVSINTGIESALTEGFS